MWKLPLLINEEMSFPPPLPLKMSFYNFHADVTANFLSIEGAADKKKKVETNKYKFRRLISTNDEFSVKKSFNPWRVRSVRDDNLLERRPREYDAAFV